MQEKGELNDFEKRFLECDTKFKTIFDLTSVATKVIRSDLTIVKVNAALCELLGYPPEELEGTKILDHACDDHKAHWHHLQEELWARAVPFFKLQASLYRKDRTVVWVNVTTILYKDNDETFGFTVLDDITSRKDFEASQKRLNIALKYTKTAIWELELQTGEIFRSPDHDEIFGYPERQQQWTVESYYPHLSEEYLPAFKSALARIPIEGGMDIQVKLNRPDSAPQWLNIKGRAEYDEHGNAMKLIGVINDITNDKLIERYKDDFISIASHELKTPVTSLKVSLQLLSRAQDGLSERLKTLLVQANKGINRISSIIDDLLNAGRSYQDQLPLKKTTFNMYELANEICDQFPSSNAQAITLSGDRHLMIHADPERIGRVLTNLISNAVKYAPGSAEIKTEIQDGTDLIKVTVADQGAGISPEKIPLLFDRYYQADIQTEQYSGLGLGLFISATIIRKHKGEIGVDTIPGKGSTFWFTLPK